MRSFRDSSNVEWTVFEVRRQVGRADAVSASTQTGWLCFESNSAKRRLLKYPDRWREFADAELTRLLDEAKPAPRPALNFPDDGVAGSTAQGA